MIEVLVSNATEDDWSLHVQIDSHFELFTVGNVRGSFNKICFGYFNGLSTFMGYLKPKSSL